MRSPDLGREPPRREGVGRNNPRPEPRAYAASFRPDGFTAVRRTASGQSRTVSPPDRARSAAACGRMGQVLLMRGGGQRGGTAPASYFRRDEPTPGGQIGLPVASLGAPPFQLMPPAVQLQEVDVDRHRAVLTRCSMSTTGSRGSLRSRSAWPRQGRIASAKNAGWLGRSIPMPVPGRGTWGASRSQLGLRGRSKRGTSPPA